MYISRETITNSLKRVQTSLRWFRNQSKSFPALYYQYLQNVSFNLNISRTSFKYDVERYDNDDNSSEFERRNNTMTPIKTQTRDFQGTCRFLSKNLPNIMTLMLWIGISEEDLRPIMEEPETCRWVKTFKKVVVHERFELYLGPFVTQFKHCHHLVLERNLPLAIQQAAISYRKDVEPILKELMMPWSLMRGTTMDVEDNLGLDLMFS
jgi:hypothetical protein